MRIVMMGTGPFAVPTFQSLLDSEHEVIALVTRPPRSAPGRRKQPVNPMRAVAQARGLSVLMPEDVNAEESRADLAGRAADLLVVCDYGQILSADVLSATKLGGINLHASLLPKYRGAAPINWALHHGETKTGVTVIHMTPRLDAGPCLVQQPTAIEDYETAHQLEERLAKLGVEPVHEAIRILAAAGPQPPGIVQDTAQATRAPRLKKADGRIDWTRTAEQIRNQVRAMQPWPGSYTNWLREDQPPLRLILEQASVATAASTAAAPGEVVLAEGNRLLVATGKGVLAVQNIKPAGKRAMPAAQFLRGYPVNRGDIFGD